MAVLSAQSIRKRCELDWLIEDFSEKQLHEGMTYGVSSCSYDIRIDQDVTLYPISLSTLIINALARVLPFIKPRQFFTAQANTIEKFNMPTDLTGKVLNKSTRARNGLDASMTTNLEPNWRGHLTLELSNRGHKVLHIKAGSPIAQISFEELDEPTDLPYNGKYQDQPRQPVPAIHDDQLSHLMREIKNG